MTETTTHRHVTSLNDVEYSTIKHLADAFANGTRTDDLAERCWRFMGNS